MKRKQPDIKVILDSFVQVGSRKIWNSVAFYAEVSRIYQEGTGKPMKDFKHKEGITG